MSNLALLFLAIASGNILSDVTAFLPPRGPRLKPPSYSLPTVSQNRRCPIEQVKDTKRFFSDANKSSEEEDEEPTEALYFDDFDFVIGGDEDAGIPPVSESSPPGWKNKLDERIKETQQQEIYRDTKLMQSWKKGDWSVRGFSLDPFDGQSEASSENQNPALGDGNIAPTPNPNPITVSKVVKDVNSDGERIWVGRSNGSLFWITLGSEYLTHFRSSASSDPKNDDDADTSKAENSGSELVRDESNINSFISEGTEQAPPPLERPFSILAQFSPSPGSAPISTILSVPDEDCVFTACEGSGQIQQWHIKEDDITSDSPTLKTPMPLSDGIHNGAIVALKTVSFKESLLLLSVGGDGTLALWDIPSADLVYHCQISLADFGESEEESQTVKPTGLVHCADVDEDKIFLGTASGFVLGYDVADLMNSASSGSESCPLPQGKFRASEEGVTAIACGGKGTLGRRPGDDKTSSSVLLTGGGNGLVKQWEILSSPQMQKMENWPKLPTQRLPKKAHLFEGHDAAVTALEAMDGRRPQFLSASLDGTIRAWDSTNGKEAYRMDGFTTDLTSLCLQGGSDTDDDMLITNGMKEYVCVHDFTDNLDEDSIDDYFEQWED